MLAGLVAVHHTAAESRSASAEGPGGAPALQIEGVRPLTSDVPPFPLVETFLAVNPLDPDNLLASAMATTAETSVVYGSRDGGDTWSLLSGPDGNTFPGGDPMLVFDGSGRAYFSTITPEMHVWRSEDGGRTWLGPSIVGEGKAADRQWVAASREPTRETLPLYAAAKTPEPGGSRGEVLLFTVSRDGGASFAEPTLMPLDSGYLQVATDLLVRDDGAVVLPFLVNYGRVPGPEEVYRGRRWTLVSGDGGKSWTGPFPVAGNLQYGNRSWDLAMMGLGGGGLAQDLSDGPHDGSIYMTWAALLDGHLQIVLTRSVDGGRSWSEPVRVNDGGPESNHSTPAVAVNYEGLVLVSWNDRRHDPEELCFRHYVALSADGGRSFGPGRPVTEEQTCPGRGSRWLNGGDTQGLAALPDGSFRTVWTGGRSRGMRPWTAVVRVP